MSDNDELVAPEKELYAGINDDTVMSDAEHRKKTRNDGSLPIGMYLRRRIPRDWAGKRERQQHRAVFPCETCFSDKPEGLSPSEWSSIEAGWTAFGLQVRCKRCNPNIIHIDFEGQQHPTRP